MLSQNLINLCIYVIKNIKRHETNVVIKFFLYYYFFILGNSKSFDVLAGRKHNLFLTILLIIANIFLMYT